MSIEEIQTAIGAFQEQLRNPELTSEQRNHFESCLNTAQTRLTEATSPSTAPPAAAHLFRTEAVTHRVSPQGSALFAQAPTAAPHQAQAAQGQGSAASGSAEKKKVSSPSPARSARTASRLGSPTESDVFEGVMDVPETRFRIRFKFAGGGESEVAVTPGQAASKVRQNLRVAVGLKRKDLQTSRCFHRAIVYYSALCQKTGKVLSAKEIGLRSEGHLMEIFKQVQAARQSA